MKAQTTRHTSHMCAPKHSRLVPCPPNCRTKPLRRPPPTTRARRIPARPPRPHPSTLRARNDRLASRKSAPARSPCVAGRCVLATKHVRGRCCEVARGGDKHSILNDCKTAAASGCEVRLGVIDSIVQAKVNKLAILDFVRAETGENEQKAEASLCAFPAAHKHLPPAKLRLQAHKACASMP